ncbi:hypothetical protein ACHAXA_000833, partial [Cyclostephanos tholiformis]
VTPSTHHTTYYRTPSYAAHIIIIMDSVIDDVVDGVGIVTRYRSSRPPFPEPGSCIGNDDKYFCLGRLGKGTFCSIHKCVDLSHSHRRYPTSAPPPSSSSSSSRRGNNRGEGGRGRSMGGGGSAGNRIVAAKVELANFVDSGNVVRTGTTPSDRNFKIVDFGLSKSFVVPRDSSLADQKRPWNGMWMSPSLGGRVDISSDEGVATNNDDDDDDDDDDGDDDVNTAKTTAMPSGGCVRLERESADFRGTSMYASLRVHQGKDHCPRDDVWGLLYVFCDLVSGGLPWMGHASARDRGSCQILKEMVMGERGRDDWAGDSKATATEGGRRVEGMACKPDPDKIPGDGSDAMEWLLFGAEYHNAVYRRDVKVQCSSEADSDSLPSLPEPLALSKNAHYVDCLRRAFRHVASLGFAELPDYDLIAECLRGFLRDVDPADDSAVPPIDWKDRPASSSKRPRRISNAAPPALDSGGVQWHPLDDDVDPLDDGALAEAEIDRRVALEAAAALEDSSRSAKLEGIGGVSAASALDPGSSLAGEAADLARLPLQLQFRLSQVEYNARHPDTIAPHVALRDWMALAVPLAHGTWDTATWERGNHRTDNDGYRNEVYMSMLQKCLEAADPFDRFSNRECYYHHLAEGETKAKRRRVCTSAVPQLVSENFTGDANGDDVSESQLVVVSRVFFSLRLALDMERGKNFAPPPKLSFGFGRA